MSVVQLDASGGIIDHVISEKMDCAGNNIHILLFNSVCCIIFACFLGTKNVPTITYCTSIIVMSLILLQLSATLSHIAQYQHLFKVKHGIFLLYSIGTCIPK